MRLRRFLANTSGASAAEFALVLPLLLLLIFGTIDVGLYAWRINQLEKAAQFAVRFAVVTAPVAQDLTAKDYIGNTACGAALTAGDTICAAALSPVICTSTGNCTCTGNCPGLTRSSTAFTNILTRAQIIAPWLTASNLRVEYRGSGLGYAADTGMDVAPLVTVRLQGTTYTPITLVIFGAAVSMPNIERTLTMEDGLGTQSN